MKVVLRAENSAAAAMLKNRIVSSVKNGETETWSYKRSSDDYDIIYHDPLQYVSNPQKNVLFRVEVSGCNVVLSSAWWSRNPEPAREMVSLHVGRLTEMLLIQFPNQIMDYSIKEF